MPRRTILVIALVAGLRGGTARRDLLSLEGHLHRVARRRGLARAGHRPDRRLRLRLPPEGRAGRGDRRGRGPLLPRLRRRPPLARRPLRPGHLRSRAAVQDGPLDARADEAGPPAPGPDGRMVAPRREDRHRPHRLPGRRPHHSRPLFPVGPQGRVRPPRRRPGPGAQRSGGQPGLLDLDEPHRPARRLPARRPGPVLPSGLRPDPRFRRRRRRERRIAGRSDHPVQERGDHRGLPRRGGRRLRGEKGQAPAASTRASRRPSPTVSTGRSSTSREATGSTRRPGGPRSIPGRTEAGRIGPILADGAFLNVLELALESQKLALDTLAAVLETQYPNGNIPSWRSRTSGTADRSQPPLGSYVVLKLFERLGDLEILRRAYPSLQRWHDFWTAPGPDGRARRDGNGDGLLEWGSDAALVGKDLPSWERNASGKMRACRESGQEDLPNWDDASYSEETGTLTLNCLDLNSLYALDAWCLAEIARVLGRPFDVDRYREQYDRTKALINARLWNEKSGFYFDRALGRPLLGPQGGLFVPPAPRRDPRRGPGPADDPAPARSPSSSGATSSSRRSPATIRPSGPRASARGAARSGPRPTTSSSRV